MYVISWAYPELVSAHLPTDKYHGTFEMKIAAFKQIPLKQEYCDINISDEILSNTSVLSAYQIILTILKNKKEDTHFEEEWCIEWSEIFVAGQNDQQWKT